MPKQSIAYLVVWSDTHCIVDGSSPLFPQSIHQTNNGAKAEAKRLRSILRKSKGNITTRYAVRKWPLLP